MPKPIDKNITEDIGRTADGEPRVERGTADSAISRPSNQARQERSDDLQGDTDFERTNAEGERLLDKT